jgi:hypothetical protein
MNAQEDRLSWLRRFFAYASTIVRCIGLSSMHRVANPKNPRQTAVFGLTLPLLEQALPPSPITELQDRGSFGNAPPLLVWEMHCALH